VAGPKASGAIGCWLLAAGRWLRANRVKNGISTIEIEYVVQEFGNMAAGKRSGGGDT